MVNVQVSEFPASLFVHLLIFQKFKNLLFFTCVTSILKFNICHDIFFFNFVIFRLHPLVCRNISLLDLAETLFLKQRKQIPYFCLDAVVGLNVKISEYFPQYFAFYFPGEHQDYDYDYDYVNGSYMFPYKEKFVIYCQSNQWYFWMKLISFFWNNFSGKYFSQVL